MRTSATTLGFVLTSICTGTCTSTAAIAQSRLEVHNFRGVVSQVTHPLTGANYPHGPTTPPGYLGAGVAPQTRCWITIPERRFKGGHQPSNFLTIQGMSQVIFVGAGTTDFSQHYQFKTGVAPARTVSAAHGFEHATRGADIVSFPSAPITVNSITGFRHSFTLATPVALPEVPLVLFVEFRGGEQRDHAARGQTLQADWRGGTLNSFTSGVHYGYTTGTQRSRTVTITSDPVFRGQIGMIVAEPTFTATGYHGNRYFGPLANETFLGIGASIADFHTNANSNLFFHVDAGPGFSNGSATVLFNFNNAPFPGRIPTPFGNLMLAPTDPFLTTFADAGVVLNLNGVGIYDLGPTTPFAVPPLGAAALGYEFQFQGAILAGATSMLTNRSSTVIQ